LPYAIFAPIKGGFQNLSYLWFQNLGMTSDWLGEIFEGGIADMWGGKCKLVLVGGRATW
jgi:hypothetical protein